MSAKRRSKAKRGGQKTASKESSSAAAQSGAQMLFFITIAFVAAHEAITGLIEPYRTPALWALVGAATLVSCARRHDARFTDDLALSFSSRARVGVLVALAICAALAIAGIGNRQHGLLAASTSDAALVGGLVYSGAVLAWGGAASAVLTLLGRTWAAVLLGALMFTMAFFTGLLYADAAVLVASLAATFVAQRSRSVAFPAVVFAYGAGGAPAAIVTTVLYVSVAVARSV